MIFSPPLTAIEPVLSINRGNVKSIEITPNLISIPHVVMTFFAVSEAAIYSASVVDKETPVCLADRQNIGPPAILIRDPVVDLQSVRSAPQFESKNAANWKLRDPSNRIP